MPTKTSPKTPARPRRAKPTSAAGGRFGRTGPSTRKPPTRVPMRRPKGRTAAKGGLAGLLSALPVPGKKPASKASPASKAKPAFAVLAAGAGALLGRKQLQKRKQDETTPVTVSPPTTGFPADTTSPTTGGPEAGPRI